MGHELSTATSLASVLVGCVMRTSAIIIVLGQSHHSGLVESPSQHAVPFAKTAYMLSGTNIL